MHTNLPNVTLVSPRRGGWPRGFDVTYPANGSLVTLATLGVRRGRYPTAGL